MTELAKEIFSVPLESIRVELIGEGDFKDEKVPGQEMKKRKDVSAIYKLLRDRLGIAVNDALVVYD